MKKRCVNIDWLELHAYEPIMTSLNAAYFRSKGYHVEEREYGTRVYREMFTILDSHGYGMIEVRRNPASQGLDGIHSFNECHIRLTNRTCYFDNAADLLNDFVTKHQYYNVRISRIDLCLDFSAFDKGVTQPPSFGDTSNIGMQRLTKVAYTLMVKIHGLDRNGTHLLGALNHHLSAQRCMIRH